MQEQKSRKHPVHIVFWENPIVILAMGLAMSICIQFCINDSGEKLYYSNSFLSMCVMGSYVAFLFYLKRRSLWTLLSPFLRSSMLYTLLFAAAVVSGVQLDTFGKVFFSKWYLIVAVVVLGISWTPICAWLMWKLSDLNAQDRLREPKVEDEKAKRFFVFVWIGLFCAYVITLLASWPGFFTYDAEAEVYMVFTQKYTTYQPLMHVALLGWILRIFFKLTGSYNVGIVVYLLLQMLVVSGCFAYMLTFLKKFGVKRWICNVSTLFLGFFPTVSMFVCCTTKDIYFSAGITLLTTLLLEEAGHAGALLHSKRKKALFLIASLMIMLFRNNGVYAYVLMTLIFLWVYRQDWKRWLMLLGGSLLIFVIVSESISLIFRAKEGPIAEMLCVPMQQLARTHQEAEADFDEEEKEIMYSLIPESILENYNPKLADSVKLNFLEDNFKADPGKYIKLWAKKGIEHPDIYVNSFLMNTYGYWYPDTILDGYTGIWVGQRQYEESSYFAFVTENPGIRKSFLPWLERFYERISLEIYQQKLPGILVLGVFIYNDVFVESEIQETGIGVRVDWWSISHCNVRTYSVGTICFVFLLLCAVNSCHAF